MKTIRFLGHNVSVSSTALAFLLRGALVLALSLCANSAVLAQGTWMPWADTGNLGNSSPTGDQPPRAVGQSDEIFYTNFSGQLQFLQFGGTPRVVASGSYVYPECWGSGDHHLPRKRNRCAYGDTADQDPGASRKQHVHDW